MKVFKIFLSIEKEEKWINDMCSKGYKLTGKFMQYKFEKTSELNKKVSIDFRFFKTNKDFADYKMLFEDSGWNHISGSKNSGNQYFEKIKTDDEEDIFSDDVSRVAKLKRYVTFWAFYTLIMICALTGTKGLSLNPKNLFLTPGLWDRVGNEFWNAFWFELPFVVLRGFFNYGFFLLAFGYVYFSYASAKNLLKKTVTQR